MTPQTSEHLPDTEAGKRVGAKRRFHWPRVFGYDFFISFKLGHPPIGAQSYASDLARRLRERDFTVFFSEEEAPPGAQLDETLVRALRRSSVLVVVVNEGALLQSTWVRKEVEEFRRAHPARPVIPIVVDRALEKLGSSADCLVWLRHEGRIWLDEAPSALEQGIAGEAVVDRLAVSHRFIRANTWFRWTVAAIILALTSLASWAAYEAWTANRRFREATALRLAAEGAAMTMAQRPGGSVRGLLQVLASWRIVPSSDAAEALQAEFLNFRRQMAIRETDHPIDSLAFGDDGRVLVSGSHDGHIQLWNAETAMPLDQGWSGRGPISTIAFGPEPGGIVTGTPFGFLQQWDRGARQLRTADPSIPPPWFNWSVAVSGDGRRFAWGREMGDIVLWDLSASKPIAHLAGATIGAPLGLNFSPDGRYIAYYSSGGQVGVVDSSLPLGGSLVWKADTGGGTGFGPMMDFGVRSGVVAFSPDGAQIVSGTSAGSLQWWNAMSGQVLSAPLESHEGGVTALAFSPDGNWVVSGGNDRTVKIWSADTRTLLNRGEAPHTGPVTALAFSQDSGHFASASIDGTVRIWAVGGGATVGRHVQSNQDDVTAIAFSDDGTTIVSGAGIRNMGERRSNVFARSPAGSRAVLRVGKNELWLADETTGQNIALLADNQVPVDSVMFSPNGALIASIGAKGVVLLWDGRTGRAMPSLHTDPRGVASIAMSPDGQLIATGGNDSTLALWSAVTGKPLRQVNQAHSSVVYCLAFSPDGRRLASGGGDRTLKIWSVDTGTLLSGPMLGHEAGVRSVAFSPDGSHIVSGGGIPYQPQGEQARLDYSLRLWDAATGRPIGRPMLGHVHDVQSVAFSRAGTRVASASLDGSTRVWEVFGGWADALCAKLPRNPTELEWRDWISPAIDFVCPCPSLEVPAACGKAAARK